MQLEYSIDGDSKYINIDDGTEFSNGDKICLAEKFNDITKTQSWYNRGYDIVKTTEIFDINIIKSNIQNLIGRMVADINKNALDVDFVVEKYHHFVNEIDHIEIIRKTRELNLSDFGFKPDKLLSFLSNLMKTDLDWRSSGSYDPKIIVRINTPSSSNFNPAHKDIYQVFDKTHQIPKMVNLWIPICGVKNKTGLPVASGSHLIPENKVLRTKAGVLMEGTKYNVNCIKSWNGDNSMKTIVPKEDQMIIFSSYLIHGLAQNYNDDETRISLEFRLFGTK